jgi:hypothetical protein
MVENWMDDIVDVKESTGVFDEDVEYLWEISGIEKQKDVVIHKDAPSYARGKVFELLTPVQKRELEERGIVPPNGVTSYLNISFICVDNSKMLKKSFNISKATINEKEPQWESGIITFIRNLGHPISPNTQIRMGDFIKPGLRFTARVKPQLKDGQKSGFHEIDIFSIKPAKGAGAKSSAPTTTATPAASPEIVAEIKAIVASAKNKDDAINIIVSSGKAGSLLGHFMNLCAKGEIKF